MGWKNDETYCCCRMHRLSRLWRGKSVHRNIYLKNQRKIHSNFLIRQLQRRRYAGGKTVSYTHLDVYKRQVLLIINLLVPDEWIWIVYLIQITNISGATGDFYVTVKFLKMPEDILVKDKGVSMTVYAPKQQFFCWNILNKCFLHIRRALQKFLYQHVSMSQNVRMRKYAAAKEK